MTPGTVTSDSYHPTRAAQARHKQNITQRIRILLNTKFHPIASHNRSLVQDFLNNSRLSKKKILKISSEVSPKETVLCDFVIILSRVDPKFAC